MCMCAGLSFNSFFASGNFCLLITFQRGRSWAQIQVVKDGTSSSLADACIKGVCARKIE